MNYDQQTTYYLELTKQMLDEAFGENRRQWIRRVEAELSQIRQVFAWLKEEGETQRGLQLANFLQELWFEEQHTEEGLSLIQEFLMMADENVSPSLRAMSLDLAGAFALSLNQLQIAHSLKTEAIKILREVGDRSQLGYALLHQGHSAGYGQHHYDEAQSHYREALGIFMALDDQDGIAHATGNLSSVTLELGDTVTAQTLVEESLKRYSELISEWDLALTLRNAAGVAAKLGQFDRAVQLAAASAAHRDRIGVSLPDAFKSRLTSIEEAASKGLNEEQYATAWNSGQVMTLVEAVDFSRDDDSGLAFV